MNNFILSKLKITVWNSQSLKPKIPEFSKFLNDHKVDIGLISETWLNSSIKISIPGFYIYRSNRNSDSRFPHGGVAICVRIGISHSHFKSINLAHVENCFIRIPFENSYLTIGSLYCPPQMSVVNFKSDLSILMSLPGPLILAGDFNAKHTSWNNFSNNRKGIELVKLADSHLSDILCPNIPTLYPSRGNPSTVDLVVRKDIDCLSSIKTINDLSSDHLPILFEVSSDFRCFINQNFDFHKADWKRFRCRINDQLSQINLLNLEFSSSNSIDSAIDCFTDMIRVSAEDSIPKFKPSHFKYPYSDHINRLKKFRNYYRKLYNETLNPSFKSCMNQLNRMIKSATSKLNEESWNLKLSRLDFRDCSLYRLASSIKRKRIEVPPLSRPDGDFAFSDEEKAQLLADNFYSIHESAANLTSPRQSEVNNAINWLNNQVFSFRTEDHCNMSDLRFIIKGLKVKRASGFDEVSNRLMRNLPERALSFMVDLFNGCLKLGYFPSAWKLGKVIALPKPNKNIKDVKSYRPITLLSCIGKIFERVIQSQINDFLSKNDILINQQFGIRPGHSTTKQILRLSEEISFDFNRDLTSGMVMLDIEKAFDSVWHDGLLFKLIQLKFPIHLIKITQSFLVNRKSFIQIKDARSAFFDIKAGVPQGSVLSPTYFNIYINDVPTPPGCKKAIYADDTSLKTTAGPHGIKQIVKKLENGLKLLDKYFSSWKIKLNQSKTEAILFSHSRIICRDKESNKISFNGQVLEWKPFVKYLGLLLDSKLIFKANTTNNITKTRKAISLIYPLLKKGSSVSLNCKLLLFKLYLMPLLTYACPVWSNMSKCHIDKLQVTQNKILRMVLSAPYCTRITEMHNVLKFPYFEERILNQTNKFYSGLQFNDNPLINNLGNYTTENVGFRVKHKLPKRG